MGSSERQSLTALAILLAALIVSGALLYKNSPSSSTKAEKIAQTAAATITLISPGAILPEAQEQEMARQLVALGVIDPAKLPRATELNVLWAFGLASKNRILTEGPMMDPRYGGPERMASVGGWTAARGNAMDHYAMHALVALSPEQQALVERVSQKVFRPCCKNSAYFPDCNHGMAMLGLLEILASEGKDEQALLAAADAANALWFPPVQQTQGNCGLEAPVAVQPNCGLQITK